jgi:hypothetical protein
MTSLGKETTMSAKRRGLAVQYARRIEHYQRSTAITVLFRSIVGPARLGRRAESRSRGTTA